MAGNFFLIGLMGVGKTTLGRQLAQHLHYDFYDSDHVICERTGVSIPTIFELEGEQGFRAREIAVIDELTRLPRIVLASGGGVVTQEANRQSLRDRGTVIYLHAQPELLWERTRYDRNRPLLQVADPLAKLTELYQARDPLYRATAHCVLDVGHQRCQHTFKQLLQLISTPHHAHAHR
ncbi:shikimate kinase [Neisseria sp. HSC-16F19]|nr:shikimate kinase [Neisseria sp. HSC-16F19]